MQPSLYKKFCEEYFVAHKTHHPLNAIAPDQAHEQFWFS